MADDTPTPQSSATAVQIVADYPYLSEADQARAVEISNVCSALMKLAVDGSAYPQSHQRASFGQQIGQIRQSMISALAMKP